MDFLAAEIQRTKSKIDQTKQFKSAKYVRRGDLQGESLSSQNPEDEPSTPVPPSKVRRKRPRSESADESQPTAASGAAAPSPELEGSSDDVVVSRLRRLREPIRLFGESDRDRLVRLTTLELQRGDDTQVAAGYEQFNRRITSAGGGAAGEEGGDSPSGQATSKPRQDPMDLSAGQFDDEHDFVRAFYKALLQKWQAELAARTADEAVSVSGRALTSSVAQLAAYTKPFFKLCKKRTLPAGMLPNIVNMVNLCLQREYAKAESCYFDLSIGRAAWPMGVTTTGIHNRASRTKLFENNVAHVMNDEQQRKYITSLKRLMTECERWYPTDPSKSTSTAGLAK